LETDNPVLFAEFEAAATETITQAGAVSIFTVENSVWVQQAI